MHMPRNYKHNQVKIILPWALPSTSVPHGMALTPPLGMQKLGSLVLSLIFSRDDIWSTALSQVKMMFCTASRSFKPIRIHVHHKFKWVYLTAAPLISMHCCSR